MSFVIRRGRPVKDIFWSEMVNQPLFFIENDEDENIRLLNDQNIPRGCFRTWKSEKIWRCHFYIGGAQRVLGRGTLYQCAKLYDYALVLFEKYRIRKSVEFNFSKPDAESEMLDDPAIRKYFSDLERYMLEAKLLKSDAEALAAKEIRSAIGLEKKRAREHKRTIAGTIESWMRELQPHIFDIADRVEEANRKLDKSEERRQVIEARLALLEAEVPSLRPASKITY